MKIDNMPQAIVASVALIVIGGLAGFLVWSGWTAEAIVAAVLTVGGLFTGQYVTARRASLVDAKQDQQSEKLDRITHQTNGAMRALVADAVERGITRGIAQYRHEQGRSDLNG